MTGAASRLGIAALWLLFAQPGGGTIAIVHYDAQLQVDILAGRVAGTVILTAVGRHAAADALILDSGDLTVDTVAVDGGSAEFSTQDHHLHVRLPRAIQPGQHARVSVAYHGQPRGGIRFFADPQQVYTAFSTSQWLVCVDAPDQKATLRLSVTTTPAGLVTVGSGRPVGERAWVLDTPTSTYLFGFVSGRFHSVTESHRGVQLRYLSDAFSEVELRAIFKETLGILAFFEERAGVRYRGGVYTQVLAAGNVEQEAGLFTLLNAGNGRAMLDDPDDVWLEAHEFAHQWWGNGVTCRAWTDFWLNEGMATFMADAYKERRFGREAYLKEIDASRARYQRVRDAGNDKALVFPDWSHPTASDRVIVYHKGAYVLYLLRERLGERRFWAGLRAYTRASMGRSVTTADFQQAMERETGVDLSDFFRQWVYTAGGGV